MEITQNEREIISTELIFPLIFLNMGGKGGTNIEHINLFVPVKLS